jgi:hypothetical protein
VPKARKQTYSSPRDGHRSESESAKTNPFLRDSFAIREYPKSEKQTHYEAAHRRASLGTVT